ncbi:serine protease [Kitasatospora sp. NPDC058965]|uniref:serine protease n=1 Tax=Kitasatospora sp. NPDC058965 TaxID=3346682 RepID=UPI0036C33FEE
MTHGALVRLCDHELRELGYGCWADDLGSLLTAYQTVAGAGPGLTADGEPVRPARVWPELGLALLTADRLPTGRAPLPIWTGPAEPDRAVLLPGPGAPVAGTLVGSCTALSDGPGPARLLPGVLLLDLSGAAAPPAGLPVLDRETGALLALTAPGLRGLPAGLVPAVRPAGAPVDTPAELAELLVRNALAAPGHGAALNLGGVLRATARQLAGALAGPGRIADLAADRVERDDGLAGEEPGVPLTVLVGEPGSGRTTELAAVAVRRAGGARALPTLWLRGADLAAGDDSVAAAVGRALVGAGAAAEPAAVARVCEAGGRPLLVLLDGPEESPTLLDPAWWARTVRWLADGGVRLLVACRPESWEPPADRAADNRTEQVRLHRLGPLHGAALERAAGRYGVEPPGTPVGPLRLRLAGELAAAGVPVPAGADRGELFAARVDLACLRIAERLAEEAARPASHRKGAPPVPPQPVAPREVRRLAATVAGRLHEAARRMLGPGQGGLGADAFAELFPAAGGWARAVLAEGLFVPLATGHRLAHEELADWLQGLHLDLDAALDQLLAVPGRRGVPRHRVGVVAAALRGLGRARGAGELDRRLGRLDRALADPASGPEARWWAARLLAAGLAGSPEPTVHQDLLDGLAERLAAGRDGVGEWFGPAFWERLALPEDRYWALLRVLVRADGPEQAFRALAVRRLRAAGAAAFAPLCAWFGDPAGLPARPGATVADLAQDLLYVHRALAVDELTEALVAAAHPGADALLTVLAVEEPSALCRAVDRWSHDPRPERHVAAAVHGLRVAPYATATGAELLRFAALTLLARDGEPALHGAALALLVRDPVSRPEHLPAALRAYAADDPFVTPSVLGEALTSDQAAVLAAFEERLARPGAGVAAVLRVLADAPPVHGLPVALPDRATRLAGRLLRDRPERAELVAEYLGRRLLLGTAGPGDLTALLGTGPGERPVPVRQAFALVLAAPGDGPGDELREQFLDRLLAVERDPRVLAAVLERVAATVDRRDGERARALVRRLADAFAAGEGGVTALDALLVRCAGRSAAFALLLTDWPARGRPLAAGPLLERMRAQTARGRDPQYAAAEAERSPVRPVAPVVPRPAGVPVPERERAHGTL